jgi:hypothetical protein
MIAKLVALLHDGQILGDGGCTADARTAIGIDQKLLFLAIAERISQPRMLRILSRPRSQGRISARWGRLERNGDRTGKHWHSSRRIAGGAVPWLPT